MNTYKEHLYVKLYGITYSVVGYYSPAYYPSKNREYGECEPEEPAEFEVISVSPDPYDDEVDIQQIQNACIEAMQEEGM